MRGRYPNSLSIRKSASLTSACKCPASPAPLNHTPLGFPELLLLILDHTCQPSWISWETHVFELSEFRVKIVILVS